MATPPPPDEVVAQLLTGDGVTPVRFTVHTNSDGRRTMTNAEPIKMACGDVLDLTEAGRSCGTDGLTSMSAGDVLTIAQSIRLT